MTYIVSADSVLKFMQLIQLITWEGRRERKDEY